MSAKNKDRVLVEACLRKDMAAWSDLIKKYSTLVDLAIKNRLKKYGLLVTPQDAEDIRQNVFADIWKNNKLESISNRDDISCWIAVLSANAALDYFRNKNTRQARSAVPLDELTPSLQADPKDELVKAELSDKIDDAVESLSAKENIMIKLHLMHDKKYSEIADILGVPKGTVSSYIKRAKEKLQKKLQ